MARQKGRDGQAFATSRPAAHREVRQVSQDFETAAVDAAGGFFRSAGHGAHWHPGSPCANCATPLQGRWCHRCGQASEDLHRSIWLLLGEVVEGVLHFDGRVWKTLPDLILRPGRLTRAYLDGHRAPQIPPLRLFLVVLLALFFVGSMAGHAVHADAEVTVDRAHGAATAARPFVKLDPDDAAKLDAALAKPHVMIMDKNDEAASSWLEQRIKKAIDDPERFKLILEQWSERFAFLTLPLATGLLSLLFMFQRRFFVFDHAIFSLHSLSAVGLLLILALALAGPTNGHSFIVLAVAPLHLFMHMRGVYGTGIIGTLVRMLVLFLASSLGLSLIALGFVWVGLNGMGS